MLAKQSRIEHSWSSWNLGDSNYSLFMETVILPARVYPSSQLRVVKAQVEVEVEIPRETPIGQPLSRGAGRKYTESGSAGLSDLEKQTMLINLDIVLGVQISCLLMFPRSSSDERRHMPKESRSRYRWGLSVR
ncbi:hypothetical protein AnigIFM63326_005128 [Aspergillus niger]|nr:hypothetical protein AnigIFM63326_005128 [Aspergillus niger]